MKICIRQDRLTAKTGEPTTNTHTHIQWFKTVVLKFAQASESPGGLVKTVAGPSARVSDAVNLVGPENLHF